MSNVVYIQRQGVFTLEEARDLLPLIKRLTRHYNLILDEWIAKLEKTPPTMVQQTTQIENQINQIIHVWNSKIAKLGGRPRGLWIVDFDHGRGYYCWKHPEPDILFDHSYEQEPRERKPILFEAKI